MIDFNRIGSGKELLKKVFALGIESSQSPLSQAPQQKKSRPSTLNKNNT